jgi:phage shock protein A
VVDDQEEDYRRRDEDDHRHRYHGFQSVVSPGALARTAVSATAPLAALPTVRSARAGERAGVRDSLKARIRELRQEREEYRAQIAAEQAEESQAREQRPRWRHAGVWTGGPAVQVSWTVP